MSPVSVIKVKVCPCFEHSDFVYSRYDEAEVVNGGFPVRVQYNLASSLVVAPRSENFLGGWS